jgi:hypothetical protein
MTFLKISTFISGALLVLTPLYAQATARPETSLSAKESAMVDWIDAHQDGRHCPPRGNRQYWQWHYEP